MNLKGTVLASSSDDESIFIWETVNGTQINTLEGHDNKIEKAFYIFLRNRGINVNIESNGVLDDISSKNK